MDSRLDQNQAELGILVLAAALEMLADGHGLFDQEVKIFRQLGGQTLLLQDTENFVSGDESDLGDTMGITQNDTCKR